MDLVICGTNVIGAWTCKVQEQIAYKCNNLISESEYYILSEKIANDINNKYKSYEQITRFNCSNEITYAMVEIIGLIKRWW